LLHHNDYMIGNETTDSFSGETFLVWNRLKPSSFWTDLVVIRNGYDMLLQWGWTHTTWWFWKMFPWCVHMMVNTQTKLCLVWLSVGWYRSYSERGAKEII
jgi:hypothetical protein